MFTKSPLISLLAASTLTAAASLPKRNNSKLGVRAMQTNWVTVTETTWVTAGADGAASSSSASSSSVSVATEAVSSLAYVAPTTTLAVASSSTSVYVAPTTTSSSSIATAATTSAIYVEAQNLAVTKSSSASSSTSSASASTSSASSSSSSKRGLAYNDASLLKTWFSQRSFSWIYNWGSSTSDVAVDTEYVPMLWGTSSTYTSSWDSAVSTALNNGSTHILSFNEPDISSQSNLAVSDAVTAYLKYISKYSGSAKLGAPATSNSNLDGEGNSWLKEFISACDEAGCVIDFCVTHWYSTADDADSLFTHLEEVHEICGDDREIWLTEFAPTGTTAEVVSFLEENLSKLDELSYLGRYSYFYVAIPNMMSSSSALNEVGSAYI